MVLVITKIGKKRTIMMSDRKVILWGSRLDLANFSMDSNCPIANIVSSMKNKCRSFQGVQFSTSTSSSKGPHIEFHDTTLN